MKKQIICFVLCSFLAGCLRAGNYDLMPVRKKIFDSMRGYTIDFSGQDEEFVRSQGERENDYVLNKALTAKKGEAILSDKYFNRSIYRSYSYRPNKKGALQNQAYPMRLDNKEEYKVLGWVTIDGKKYALLESGLEDYVFLFDENGNFYNRAGRIEDGILMMIDEEIFVYPSDLKMIEVVKTRNEVGNVHKGYEVKYGGVNLDRIWFDYMTYDGDSDSGGRFEKLNFPDKPGLIMINGKGLRILDANEEAVTYMILKD